MYYFKVTPPLPFNIVDHGGVKLFVHKNTSNISVCSSTTPSCIVVQRLIDRELRINGLLWHGKQYTTKRVNKNYFKLATNTKLNKSPTLKEDTIGDTFKLLISKSGKKISEWILQLTKYDN